MPSNSSNLIRWGILATGSIARTFATDLREVDGAVLQAVGSRRLDAAQTFADEFGATSAYGSYEELAADPDVDVIYVATPHGRHVEDVMTCFAAGKHVLCEKPIALNADQTAALIAEADARGLFFAEAMWMRANPNIIAAKKLVDDGTIGAVVQLRAELGFRAKAAKGRLWDLELGASALLDVGIYPLTLAYVMLGAPVTVVAAGVVSTGSTSEGGGFDVSGGATLTYANGAVASIAWTQMGWSDNRAAIAGADGLIEWGPPMHAPHAFTVKREGDQGTVTSYAEPVIGVGYAHEIIEVGACLRAGSTRSDLLPLDETLAIMELMDDMRFQMGVRYSVD